MSATGPADPVREGIAKREAAREKAGDIGQRIQEKFDSYLVALSFTVLGFSIQTAKPAAWRPANVIEIIAWTAFLLAGVAGLAGLQSLASFFLSQARTGDPRPSLERTKEEIKKTEKATRRARPLLRWSLVGGFILLLVARAAHLLALVQPPT